MDLARRFNKYLKKYGFKNSLRKMIFLLSELFGLIFHFIRKCRFFIRTGCWIKNIGKGIIIKGIGHQISFGHDTTLYENTVIEVDENAKLGVGDHFTLSYGGLIACHQSVEIGNDVMIGEYSSIRDTSHRYSIEGISFNAQNDYSEPIKIGNNVWIGRGCIILPGTIIEDGVILAANSSAKGYLKSNGIYAGSPLKLVKTLYIKKY